VFGRYFPPGPARLALVVACLVVIAAAATIGYLSLSPKPAAEVTVTGFNWTFEEGTVSSGAHAGIPWFGQSGENDSGSANGFPISVPSGGTLTVSVFLNNWDNVSHTIVGVHLHAPLFVVSSAPPPPATVTSNEDLYYEVTVSVQAPAGSTCFGVGSIAFT
jgi:hypothetical protein